MKIYLLNETPFEGVENLILSRVKFYDFSVDLSRFEALICTSKNALKALENAKIPLHFDGVLYAVGQKTAQAARRLGFSRVRVPSRAYAAALFEEFRTEFKGRNCLYLRGKDVAWDLSAALREAGVALCEMVVYESEFIGSASQPQQPGIFIFTSPLGVENFLRSFSFCAGDLCVALGQSTAEKLPRENLFLPPESSLASCVALAKRLRDLKCDSKDRGREI